ncbi:hypothetical protein SADUNF_Sadunf04G0131200 [Salix dunnii]|uniref:Uncharacterized protein n=1 Tax=Salix dunnii TaxID=1413687 RepID=A0A835KBL9_9ROSI|nr:hypothetical protein SADUNF_Sadunf04G0131200 [Salix dunnii]
MKPVFNMGQILDRAYYVTFLSAYVKRGMRRRRDCMIPPKRHYCLWKFKTKRRGEEVLLQLVEAVKSTKETMSRSELETLQLKLKHVKAFAKRFGKAIVCSDAARYGFTAVDRPEGFLALAVASLDDQTSIRFLVEVKYEEKGVEMDTAEP